MKKKNELIIIKPILLLIFILILTIPNTLAIVSTDLEFDQVLINSADWKDIYQGLLFSKITGKTADFILEPSMTTDVVSALPKGKQTVLLLTSEIQPQYTGVKELVRREGLDVLDLPGRGSIGENLIDKLNPKMIIVMDERYPYNAISLAPYAVQQDAMVLFSKTGDANKIEKIVEEKNVPVMIFGIIDSETKRALEKFHPEIINEGGKFDNNIAIAKKYLEENNVGQVVLTNGDFLEIELISAFNPIIFMGNENVPQQVDDFFLETNITSVVLVGNYLTDTAKKFKDHLKRAYGKEITFMVRFGKTPRVVKENSFGVPQSLDYVVLPIIKPNLNIISVTYNKLSKQLEVTYENPERIPVFFIATFNLFLKDKSFSVGDDESIQIASGQQKTVLYDLTNFEISGQFETISADGRFYYGDYDSSLEFEKEKTFESIPIIEIKDDSKLEIKKVLYDKYDKAFYITLKNPGDVITYANVELPNVIVDGLPTTLGTKNIAKLEPNEEREVYIRATLGKLDLLENEKIDVVGNYGQRKNILFKTVNKTLSLGVRILKPAYVMAGIAIIILLILAFFLLFGKKKTYYCERCGALEKKRLKPKRHHCGGKFRR